MGGQGRKLIQKRSLQCVLVLLMLINIACIVGSYFEVFGSHYTFAIHGESMQHSEEHQIDIMDDGDGIIVTPLDDNTPLHTYFEGKNTGYKTLGDYGDAVCFVYNRSSERTAHRLVCYVMFNFSRSQVTADVPEVGIYGAREMTLREYGYENQSVVVNFTYIYSLMVARNNVVREGYITKGDNIHIVDQTPGCPLIRRSDILGRIKVIDNDLKITSPLDYIAVSSIVLVMMITFSAWLMFPKDGIKLTHLSIVFSILFIIFMIVMVMREFFLIARSETLDSVKMLSYSGFVVILACLTIFMNFMVRRYSKSMPPHNNLFTSMFFILFFIPNYFVFSYISHMFGFLFFALSIFSSIYQLRPDRFFIGSLDERRMDYIVSWILLVCVLIVLLMFTILTTVPFYLFLFIGWIAGNGYGVYLIRHYLKE